MCKNTTFDINGLFSIYSQHFYVMDHIGTVHIWLDHMGILILSDFHTVLVSTKQKLG